jgi:transposase
LEDGFTYTEAAAHFGVGYASVSRWLRLHRETSQLKPKPFPGREPRIDADGEALVRKLVADSPDATVNELAAAYTKTLGVARLAPCIMHRALAKLGLTRKKRRSMRRNASEMTSRSFAGISRNFESNSVSEDASFSSTKAG